jgi:hypothetical protein
MITHGHGHPAAHSVVEGARPSAGCWKQVGILAAHVLQDGLSTDGDR